MILKNELVSWEQLNGFTWKDETGAANVWQITPESVADLNRVLYRYDMTNYREIAFFLGQSSIESASGTALREKYNGNSPEKYFPVGMTKRLYMTMALSFIGSMRPAVLTNLETGQNIEGQGIYISHGR